MVANFLPATPRSFKDPPDSPVPVKVLTKWDLFLGEIAAGMKIEDAMMKFFIKRAEIEACIRLSPEQRQRWNEARMAGRKTVYSALDLEDFFRDISSGDTIKEAYNKVWQGCPSEHFANLMFLCTQDPEYKDMYEAALKARALQMSEQILEISNGDGTGDYLDNGKGGFTPDGAKVNRDKLRVETRRGLMSSWYPKLFGEKKGDTNVNVQINHAAALEAARSRRDTKGTVKPITHDVVEAAFRPRAALPPAENEWDDVPKEATSTVWREES